MAGENNVFMYGVPPDLSGPFAPRVPDLFVETSTGTCFACGTYHGLGLCPGPALVPCATCSRHVRRGEECPFCYADAAAKGEHPCAACKAKDEALTKKDEALAKVAKALLLARSALIGAEGPLTDARVAIDEAKVALAEARGTK